ncbi:AbrB/MazE/SpoVT family DNA-binding domain-containing protein [Halorubrum sp. DTA46]|uniref:AbrB/MazE/SpoVT family DNA-binding domain-containing protein n=1 Tax=Halorubrum sp. DTA46 TaxID=3402162 RepID=UPI003AB01E50
MPGVILDDQGRLTLPADLRDQYGDRYYIVDLDDSIKLIPVVEDPLDALRDEFTGITRSASNLREETRNAMPDE